MVEDNYRISFKIHSFGKLDLSEDEIISNVPKEVMLKLKSREEHPFLQAYILCHEGKANPKLLNTEEKFNFLYWGRKAVESLNNIVLTGVRLFFGHNEDSSTTGRRWIGEVVASFQKEVDGKLAHIIITHHPESVVNEVKKYDVISQEAEWEFKKEGDGLYALKCEQVTGVAMMESAQEKPAFEGAQRLGFIFASVVSDIKEGSNKEIAMPETKSITFEDIKRGCKELNVFPWQLFTAEDIKNDKEFAKVFIEKTAADTLIAEKETQFNTKMSEVEKELTVFKTKEAQSNARQKVDKIFEELKYSSEQKKFIEKKLEKLNDFTDEGIKAFIEEKNIDFLDALSLVPNNGVEIPIKTGDGAVASEPEEEGDVDYTDPKNNDILT
jgi:hypothetical protein